uniref:Cbp1 family collagen-binding glycoprotein adhesin n=1 Tax=Prevotella sp. TaxID=59823 RepID=UPI0040284F4B
MRNRVISICFVSLTLLLYGCKEYKAPVANRPTVAKDDSLQQIISQRDTQINNMMATMNEIQEGFNEISEAENRVNLIQDDERADKASQIKEDIKFIADRMQQNRELIKKLQGQLRDSDFKSQELKKVIANMLRQLDEKDQQLQQLRAELDAKNIHIAELDETISNLNNNVTELKSESDEKSQIINNQETQLNTAWYVFGTRPELKDQRILMGDKVLQQNFNKNYFTKIDIRVTREIKLYSKSARLLTSHPAGSYELTRDNNKMYTLAITNPQLFWSTSKYLVVVVK